MFFGWVRLCWWKEIFIMIIIRSNVVAYFWRIFKWLPNTLNTNLHIYLYRRYICLKLLLNILFFDHFYCLEEHVFCKCLLSCVFYTRSLSPSLYYTPIDWLFLPKTHTCGLYMHLIWFGFLLKIALIMIDNWKWWACLMISCLQILSVEVSIILGQFIRNATI